jgi:hypothetical protein
MPLMLYEHAVPHIVAFFPVTFYVITNVKYPIGMKIVRIMARDSLKKKCKVSVTAAGINIFATENRKGGTIPPFFYLSN